MLLDRLVAAADEVAATRARSAKVRILAGLLRALASDEIEAAVGFLTGSPRQGKVGVGWAGITSVDVPASADAELTVLDVDQVLSRLAALEGPGSTAARQGELARLLGRATAAEQSFLRRLLVGELRQGALEGVMADAVAAAAAVPAEAVRRAAMFTGDLGRTARIALTGGSAALAALGLELHRPVQPMLAASAPGVAAALAETGPASIEWKLDGARIQVHRNGDHVRVFTRNLNDVTDRLPGVVAVVRAMPATRLVLDGEAIGLHADATPRMFQETMARLGSEGGDPGLQPFFFDVLHLDGTDLVDEPLRARLAALTEVAGPWRVPSITTDDPDAAAAFLDEALAHGHEGVMVKSLGSAYEAGRRGGAWRKVKPVRTLDLVVLAAEWGSGRRRGWLSNLHLGARDPVDGGFVMVGKTFKGLTDALLAWQTGELLARELGREGPVVHVRPELVVEVALDGVQVSRRYPGGVALRFARVRRYRPDKRADEADTIEQVRALLPTR